MSRLQILLGLCTLGNIVNSFSNTEILYQYITQIGSITNLLMFLEWMRYYATEVTKWFVKKTKPFLQWLYYNNNDFDK